MKIQREIWWKYLYIGRKFDKIKKDIAPAGCDLNRKGHIMSFKITVIGAGSVGAAITNDIMV